VFKQFLKEMIFFGEDSVIHYQVRVRKGAAAINFWWANGNSPA